MINTEKFRQVCYKPRMAPTESVIFLQIYPFHQVKFQSEISKLICRIYWSFFLHMWFYNLKSKNKNSFVSFVLFSSKLNLKLRLKGRHHPLTFSSCLHTFESCIGERWLSALGAECQKNSS